VLVPYELAYKKGFEDMMKRVPDISKARKILSFKPKKKLEEILLDVKNYMQKTGRN